MAAKAGHVEVDLARRLACVDQVEQPVAARDLAHFGGRVDEAGLRRDMRDCDKPHARGCEPLQRVGVDPAGGVRRGDLDVQVPAAGLLQEGEIVRGMFRRMGQNVVPFGQGKGVEGGIPGAGCVFGEGNLIRLAAQEGGEFAVVGGKRRRRFASGLAAADLALAGKVAGERGLDRVGHQRGARVVEMGDRRAGWRLGTQAGDVHQCPPNSHSVCTCIPSFSRSRRPPRSGRSITKAQPIT